MLGNFLTRILILILGYIYPAFECYKTVEKNKVEIEELRFWCKYWILLAILASFEWVGDIFISWLPFYGEMKLMFVVFLWYPKTKGTGYVYETLVRPYIAEHETDIDRTVMEMKSRAWDFCLKYSQNFAQAGQTTLVQALQFARTQSGRLSAPAVNQAVNQNAEGTPETESRESRQVKEMLATLRQLEKKEQTSRTKSGGPPPTPPPTPSPSTADLTQSAATETERGFDFGSVNPTPGSPLSASGPRLRAHQGVNKKAA